MSIDSLAVRTEASPPPRTPVTETSPALPAPGSAPVQRPLDQRLQDLEQQLRSLVGALATARRSARDSLAELQQRCSSLTTEVLRLGARHAQQASDHEALARRVDSVEPRLQRQGQQLEILAGDLQQRTGHLHMAVETLQSHLREEQAARIGLTVAHDQLELDVKREQEARATRDAELAERLQQERRQQRRLAALLAGFALLAGGLLAWQQLDLAANPAPVREALLALQADVDRHDALAEDDALRLDAHALHFEDLSNTLERTRALQLQLRRELRAERARIAALRSDVAALRQALADQATPGVAPARPEGATAAALPAP